MSHLVCKTMSCDENSSEHDKETSSFEFRTKIVYFRYKSSILVAWINDGRPFFLLWLGLRLFIVFGEGIWGCNLRNSAMNFFWTPSSARCPVDGMLFSFIPFNGMITRDPARYHLRFFLWPRRRTQYSGPCQVLAAPLVSRYFQDGGTSTSFVRRSFLPCFVERGVFWPCLFTATELSSFVASFQTTRNLETSTFYKIWLRSFASVDSPSIFLSINPCWPCWIMCANFSKSG